MPARPAASVAALAMARVPGRAAMAAITIITTGTTRPRVRTGVSD